MGAPSLPLDLPTARRTRPAGIGSPRRFPSKKGTHQQLLTLITSEVSTLQCAPSPSVAKSCSLVKAHSSRDSSFARGLAAAGRARRPVAGTLGPYQLPAVDAAPPCKYLGRAQLGQMCSASMTGYIRHAAVLHEQDEPGQALSLLPVAT